MCMRVCVPFGVGSALSSFALCVYVCMCMCECVCVYEYVCVRAPVACLVQPVRSASRVCQLVRLCRPLNYLYGSSIGSAVHCTIVVMALWPPCDYCGFSVLCCPPRHPRCCPCRRAVLCDPLCQWRQWKRHRETCAAYVLSQTDLGKTLPLSVIYERICPWLPRE